MFRWIEGYNFIREQGFEQTWWLDREIVVSGESKMNSEFGYCKGLICGLPISS